MRGIDKLFSPAAAAATWFKQLAANNRFKIQITETLRSNATERNHPSALTALPIRFRPQHIAELLSSTNKIKGAIK